MNIGDYIKTPRFLTVRIAAMFESSKLAIECGFSEPTHYESSAYAILGKNIGTNRMIFAGISKEED